MRAGSKHRPESREKTSASMRLKWAHRKGFGEALSQGLRYVGPPSYEILALALARELAKDMDDETLKELTASDGLAVLSRLVGAVRPSADDQSEHSGSSDELPPGPAPE